MQKQYELTYDENFCIEADGKVRANIRFINFNQNIRGKWVKMGGIAMVVTDPMYRRKGYVKKIMNYLIEKMKKENFDVSALYPFIDTFYSAYGYVNISPFVRMKFDPKYFSRWKNLPEGYSVKRLSHEKGFKYYKEIHNKIVNTIHGSVKRNEKRWKEYDRPGPGWFVVTFNKNGKPEGVMKYTSKGFSRGFDWTEEGKLRVSEIHTLTPKSRHALYNYLYLHSDQIVEACLPIYPNQSMMYPWLQGYYMTELNPMNIWQARIIDVKSTLDNIAVSYDAQINIRITDKQITENNQTYAIKAHDGKLKVETSKKEAELEMTIEGLSSLVYGVLLTNDLEAFGWLKNTKEEEKALLDKWFPLQEPTLTEGF